MKWKQSKRAFECPLCQKQGRFGWFKHTDVCQAKHFFPYSLAKPECIGYYWKDTIQPYNSDGSVSKLFIKLYGTSAYDTIESLTP